MKGVTIREACLEDAQAILDINITSWRNTYKGIFPQNFLKNLCNEEKEYSNSLNKIKDKILEKRNYLVAIYNNEIVGFTNFGKSKKEKYPEYGEIYAIYVKKDFIKKGIGGKLFNATIDNLSKNYSKVIVSCIIENPSNEFYKKMNCKKIDESEFVLENKIYKENLYECKLTD